MAPRKRKRATPKGWVPSFRRSTLRNFENEATHEVMLHRLNQRNPGSHNTWGSIVTGPMSAIKKKGKAPRVKNHFTGNGSLAPLFEQSSNEEPTMLIPNSPDRSPLLGIPAEVRENIYGFLLSDPKPVTVGPDWETVQGRVLRYNGLQYVSQQIGDEATKFLYNNNVFLAMLCETRKSSALEKTLFIDPKFLALFRNVVINCPVESWNMEWHDKAALAVSKLVDAHAFLTSLTIVVCPSLGKGTSTTALGLEANPIHFADFFYYAGPLMTSIRKLKCKMLNIIVNKRITNSLGGIMFTTGTKRFLMSVDLTYLHARSVEGSALANEETVAIAHEKALALENELQGLKHKFEAIFNDHEKALEGRFCRELDAEEAITDGMALATRK
jgi:hypothetical protein